MANNLSIWSELAKTDPKHTKPFKRSGGFNGTAVKPIYCIQRMTEQFGPYGKGWGTGKPDYQLVPGENKEVLVYCTVEMWWMDGSNRHSGFGVGGDKVITYIRPNEQYKRPERWENDDEAFKKAFTDAIGNAMKHLGMSADIHMGLFDDSKYVRDLQREFSDEQQESPKKSGKRSERPSSQLNPPPQAETPFDEGMDQTDWPAYIDGFKQDFVAAGTYLAAQEYWSSQQDALKALKASRPSAYSALVAWCKTEGEKLPKEAS